ncbi:MAG: NUDIX hydrolase [Isosphaeraceae bacterium]|nr:NUDIX hydrolase [Isosphaeraceae bacterium]
MPDVHPEADSASNSSHGASWVREGAGAHDQSLEENWLFRLRRERFRSRQSGLAHDFYVMHLADAVNVIALTPDRKLVLVRQFRAGSGRDSLETPGGLLDAGEDPLRAGARELMEETGYAGGPPQRLGTVWSNPSIMTSRTTIIVIANARPLGPTKLDHGEEVTVELVPERAIPRLIREGRIDHALVVCGLLWWLESRFPGRLAPPGPKKRLKLGSIMVATAVIAAAFGLIQGSSSWFGSLAVVAVIAAVVIATVVSAFDRDGRR